MLELLLRFSGEAHDDVARDGRVGGQLKTMVGGVSKHAEVRGVIKLQVNSEKRLESRFALTPPGTLPTAICSWVVVCRSVSSFRQSERAHPIGTQGNQSPSSCGRRLKNAVVNLRVASKEWVQAVVLLC